MKFCLVAADSGAEVRVPQLLQFSIGGSFVFSRFFALWVLHIQFRLCRALWLVFFFFVWNKISRQNLFPATFDVSKRFQGFGFLQRLVLGNLVVDCAVSFAIE